MLEVMRLVGLCRAARWQTWPTTFETDELGSQKSAGKYKSNEEKPAVGFPTLTTTIKRNYLLLNSSKLYPNRSNNFSFIAAVHFQKVKITFKIILNNPYSVNLNLKQN